MPVMHIPREGPQHPLFARATHEQALEVVLTFAAAMTDDDRHAIDTLCERWVADLDWMGHGEEPKFRGASDGQSVRLDVTGVTQPRRALTALFERLDDSEMEVRDAFLSLREVDPDGQLSARVPDPREQAILPADDADLLWARSFADDADVTAALPSEDPDGMVTMLQLEDGTTLTEERSAALYIPGVRIVYGLVDVDRVEPNARDAEIIATLVDCLRASFGGDAPSLYNVRGERNTTLDHISREGRHGYAFAIVRQEMMRLYPGGFRYREHELFYGVADAVAALDLAPVIHWDRDQVYILNVWERA